MVDFLKLDLEDYYQNAILRMIDEPGGHPAIAQARFSTHGIVLEHLFTDNKPKHFQLSEKEMNILVDGWQAYRAAVAEHKAAEEARKIAAEQEARMLIEANRFDYELLNIVLREDPNYSGWCLEITALGIKRQNVASIALPETIRGMLEQVKRNVENAEAYGSNSPGWQRILLSYRRRFPKEPAEIQEARKLLSGADLTNWTITPGTYSDREVTTWTFQGPFASTGEILMDDETPEQLLSDIKEYLDRKESDKLLDAMDAAEQGEQAEIIQARALLKEGLHITDFVQYSIYPGSEPNTWSFDNGHDMDNVLLLNKPAADMLELVSQYITETKHEQGESDEMIADFWAKHFPKQGEPSEQELDVMIEARLLNTIDDESSEPFGAFAGDC